MEASIIPAALIKPCSKCMSAF